MAMGLHLVKFGYTSEAWSAMLQNPQDRREMLAARVFSVGGRLDGFWYSTGDADGYALVEWPDHIAEATVLIAIKASGSFRFLESTQLLTMDEMLEALQAAHDVAYATPGAEESPGL
jgi:uncharacterized protein with GYD domain